MKTAPSVPARIAGFFLCLVLCLSTVAAIGIGDVRIATTKENMTLIIRQALFRPQSLPAAQVGSGSGAAAPRTQPRLAAPGTRLEEPIPPADASQALVEWVYNTLVAQHADELTLTLEQVEAFVEDSTLKDTIAELGASLISDLYTGENTTVLDEETIRSLLAENAEVIKEHFDYELTPDTLDSLTQTIVTNDYVSQIQADGVESLLTGTGSGGSSAAGPDANPDADPGVPSSGTSVGDLLTAFRAATSVGMLAACIAAAVVCIAALAVLHRKWIWRALRGTGVALLIAAIPFLLPTLPALLVKEQWNSVFSGLGMVSSVAAMVRAMLEITAPVCISVFAAGLALLIAAPIVRAVSNRKTAGTELPEAPAPVEPVAEEPPAQEPETPAEEAPAEAETPAESL